MSKFLKYSLVFSFITCAIILTSAIGIGNHVAEAQTQTLTGYGWSSTIGWIGFSGTGYGVSMNPATGALTGYAWSNSIGWIQFGGLSGFPSGSGTTAANAIVNLSTGAMTGWARACDGTLPGDCSSMTSRTDGTDGWVSLSGTGYGVTMNTSTGVFSGFSWSDMTGWLSWNPANAISCDPTKDVCSGTTTPAAPSCGFTSVNPSAVAPTGGTVNAAWTSQNATLCTINGTNVATSSAGTNVSATPGTLYLYCSNLPTYTSTQCGQYPVGNTASSSPNPSISMWLNNNTSKTSTSIHPSGKVVLNWDQSAFYNAYSTQNVNCTGQSGQTINGWTNTNVSATALNNISTTTVSGLSVGTYSLDVKCSATILVDGIPAPVSSTTNPVTITVTNSTIHEQ